MHAALTHYRITKQQERSLKLGEEEGDYKVKPVTEPGSGQARDPNRASRFCPGLMPSYVREEDRAPGKAAY